MAIPESVSAIAQEFYVSAVDLLIYVAAMLSMNLTMCLCPQETERLF
jgi:hypothetical protein